VPITGARSCRATEDRCRRHSLSSAIAASSIPARSKALLHRRMTSSGRLSWCAIARTVYRH
jgi:hypothetical protein